MGALVREMDWASTPIGAPETWSNTLRTVVSLVLANRFPQLLWWGPDYISIYNDACRPILARNHPGGLGKPVRECWSEIWSVLQPLIDTPFHGGPSTWVEDVELEIQRAGFTEETHFTVACSPVPDDAAPGGIGGVLATVHEISEKVLGTRRIGILRDLGSRAAEARSAGEAWAVAAATLARHQKDIPFALLYVIDPDDDRARLADSCGFREEAACGPAIVDLTAADDGIPTRPFAAAYRTGVMQGIGELSGFLPEVPPGPWSEPPYTAVVVPIRSTAAHQLSGFLVAGISSRLRLDESYRNFLELAASQIATGVANARAYEEERRRTPALAEIDRAGTAFFPNVSHELRTPLNLMLGPLEGLMAKESTLAAGDRELLAHVENTLHLQRVRRENLEEIARSESRFRACVTGAADVIYRMNADWSELRFLQGKDFLADTEHPTRDWLEKYIHPEDQPGVLAAIHAAIQNKATFELEHRVIRRDGTRGWAFSRSIPVLNAQGEIGEWFGAARDVTTQRSAALQLEEALDRLRFMAESMPQKIATTTPDGEVDYINRQWIDYTGFSLEDMQNSGWARFIHPDDVEENLRAWREALASGEAFQMTHRFRRADGEYRWHLSRSVPLRDVGGKIMMWIGSSTEIHEQKRIEEELRRVNRDLEQFAYSASHDLQEPLRGIRIFSQLLSERYRPKLDGQALEFLDHVQRGAKRLEMLLRDLLTYTEAGKVERLREPVNAGDALRAALENLAGPVAASGARIDSGSLPPLFVAPGQLQQLFQNLIGNAIRYRQPGLAPLIRVEAAREKDRWHFTVNDNGIGIEPEYKETIFGLFKRLHTGDECSGTGMGLAICRRIVDRNHGRIWVESEPGCGSAFHFTLPVIPAGRKASADSHR